MYDLLTEFDQLERRAFRNVDALHDCQPVAELLIRLVAYVICEQQPRGWAPANKFEPLADAHMVRVFTSMGVRLDDRWRFFDEDRGNLSRIVDRLTRLYEEEEGASLFGEDFWDDCYVMLALVAVRDQMTADQKTFLNLHKKHIVDFLSKIASENFKNVPHGEWFGPGLHSAGILLFDALVETKLISARKAAPVIDTLVRGIVELLPEQPAWATFSGWQAGQVLSMYRRLAVKRAAELAPLAPHIAKLEADLLSWQDRDPGSPTFGGWTGGGMSDRPVSILYNTVRALAAVYVRDPKAYLSDEAQAAHAFLLREEHASPPMRSLKGAVNTIEVLHDLFQLQLPIRDVGLLLNLDTRLRRFGLKELLLTELGQNDTDTLRKLQDRVQEQIENRGGLALEPMGANGRIFKDFNGRPALVEEFGDNADNDLDEHLKRFLSATMTETRANAARVLIHRLWTHAGYFDFLPLFERLSDLEYAGKFFERYRDHTNHQLLVFLLGAYVYYNNARLRALLDAEVIETSKKRGVVVTPEEAEKEFLFRWKLASNFHDVGYIFEVSPAAADPKKEAAALIEESFALLEEFRAGFLPGLMKTHLTAAVDPAVLKALKITEYPKIHEIDHLARLTTRHVSDAFDRTSSFIPEPSRKADLIRNYYRLCKERQADGSYGSRPPFLDHGIMSALILLKIVDVQRHYLQELDDRAAAGALHDAPEILEMVVKPHFKTHLDERRYARFDHVAGAIALHNIYPKLYSQATCKAYGLEELFYTGAPDQRFGIAPADAMAWLLAFTDGLQDWDRHSFRRPNFKATPDAEPLAAPEILLVANDDGVTAVGLTEAARTRYAKRKEEMAETLTDLDDYFRVQTSLRP
jgi:hypothetical protein